MTKQQNTARARRPLATRLATATGAALVAVATVVATSPTAWAADTTTWQLTGVSPGQARSAYVASPAAKDACVTANNRWTDNIGATITTIVFTSDVNCSAGAGQQCRTTVPSNTGAVRVFDVHSCRWVQ